MPLCLDVDWSSTKDVVTIIGTVGALIIGVVGLSTWRRQLKGTAEYEVAERAVLLTHLVGHAMQAVRQPMPPCGLEEEQRIYGERIERLQERWGELRTLALETRVIWGDEAEKHFDSVRDLIGTLRAEIWLRFWLKGAYAVPGTTVDDNPERVAANDHIVHWTSDDDEFSQSIKAAVRHVEDFFCKHIRGRG
jgi:hypothetical protein